MRPGEDFLAEGGFESEGPRPGSTGSGFELDPKRVLLGLRRFWGVVLICAFLGGMAAVIRFSLTEQQFRSSSTLQIERRRFAVLAMGQQSWVEDWWNQEYYPTQHRLLKSRGIAERVVLNLRLHQDPEFTGEPRNLSLAEGATADMLASEDAAKLARYGDRLLSGLDVTPIAGTQLVRLTYVSNSPDLAARVANGVAEAFIEFTTEARSNTVKRASTFLTTQIGSLRSDIDDQLRELNSITVDTEFALDPEGEALLARKELLEKQHAEAIGDRITAEAAYREILGGGRVDSMSPDVRVFQQEISQLEGDYETKLETFTPEWPAMVQLRSEIEEKRKGLERLLSEASQGEVAQARRVLQSVERRKAFLEEELRDVSEQVRSLNSSNLEYANLRMSIETRQELVKSLLERQSETEVASRISGEEGSNARLIERAIVPKAPFRPILQVDLIAFTLGGAALGIAAIVLLTFLDRTVKTAEELERITSLPTLTVIPDLSAPGRRKSRLRGIYGGGKANSEYGYYGYSDKGSYSYGASGKGTAAPEDLADIELLPHRHPRLAVSEAYRSLRTALLLSTATRLRRIAVTSAEPGEGKTATSTNLAVVMAQLGKRVLLVDCDLRRPRLHKVFQVTNRKGLVTWLTGAKKEELPCEATSVPNLWLCSSGPIPPNPSELLASERMQQFLEQCDSQFDLVIVDTPPVLPVADAIVVGTMVDGVVLCALSGRLIRPDAMAARERLNYEHIRVFGTVLNRYKRQPGGYYDRKYNYYGTYEEDTPREKAGTAA